ncbi:hypothetical protein BH10ACI2_BH10ACI2_16210 [soil metagenome]
MKKQIGLIVAALAFVDGLSFIANAQTYHRPRGIEARQREQQQRIFHCVQSGELTRREAARLESQQVHLERVEDRYRASGNGLSPIERAKLERDLNRSSRNIYRQKHDRQDYPRP